MSAVPKILLVDDNPDNLKALEVVLRGLDADLVKVTNGNDALKATLHHDFALALLDVQMPEMDGYELANILKTEEKTENLPFIFISAVYTDHQNITKGYTKGAYNFFAKPFDPETLIRSVELFLDKYRQTQTQVLLNSKLEERTKEVEQKNTELERINKELQSFVFVASHDLQEPLRKIQTFTRMIEKKEKSVFSQMTNDYFVRIQSATERMQILIEDLLNYSQANIKDQKFQMTDLNEIARSVHDDFKELLEDKKASLAIGKLPSMKVIPFQVRQVFHNLISNAIKYSSSERLPCIKISCEVLNRKQLEGFTLNGAENFCHISVADNGIGFENQYNEKIFEMFQRLHGKGEYSGTGIGLAIVKKIIENHHGAIRASSILNEGTTFHIYLPATTNEVLV